MTSKTKIVAVNPTVDPKKSGSTSAASTTRLAFALAEDSFMASARRYDLLLKF